MLRGPTFRCLGRWNSRDFLRGRSKKAGSVHTRHTHGSRGKYPRLSSKYTIRDGRRHAGQRLQGGLGIKLGGLFGMRAPRQHFLSTASPEAYELAVFGTPNITNPWVREEGIWKNSTALEEITADAPISMALVVLLPRLRNVGRAVEVPRTVLNTEKGEACLLLSQLPEAWACCAEWVLWGASGSEAKGEANEVTALLDEVHWCTLHESVSVPSTSSTSSALPVDPLTDVDEWRQKNLRALVELYQHYCNKVKEGNEAVVLKKGLRISELSIGTEHEEVSSRSGRKGKSKKTLSDLLPASAADFRNGRRGGRLSMDRSQRCRLLRKAPTQKTIASLSAGEVRSAAGSSSCPPSPVSVEPVGAHHLLLRLHRGSSRLRPHQGFTFHLSVCQRVVLLDGHPARILPHSSSSKLPSEDEDTRGHMPDFIRMPFTPPSSLTRQAPLWKSKVSEADRQGPWAHLHYPFSSVSLEAAAQNKSPLNTQPAFLRSFHGLAKWCYANQDPRAYFADALSHQQRKMRVCYFLDTSKIHVEDPAVQRGMNEKNEINKIEVDASKRSLRQAAKRATLVSPRFCRSLEEMKFVALEDYILQNFSRGVASEDSFFRFLLHLARLWGKEAREVGTKEGLQQVRKAEPGKLRGLSVSG